VASIKNFKKIKPGWHRFYFVLAVFNLITVAVGLYLSHSLANVYDEVAQTNERWAQRLSAYSILGDSVSGLNLSGHDVFAGRDGPRYEALLRRRVEAFGVEYASVRDELDRDSSPDAQRLRAPLEQLNTLAHRLTVQTAKIFSALHAGRKQTVVNELADFDRRYAEFNRAQSQWRRQVLEFQNHAFVTQVEVGQWVRKLEMAMVAAVMIVVLVITFYGHRLAAVVSRIDGERERALRDLTDAHESLRLACEAADTANRTKSEFLANMSHEIRTPINGVIGMAALLQESALEGEQRGYAQTISHNAHYLLRLVNDVLDYSKIEAGRVTLEAVDFNLRVLMEEAMELCAYRETAKRLELAIVVDRALPPTFRGDPTRLRQVLINLVSNAVKFTERGGVTLRVRAERDLKIRFEVEDTGIGIPETHHDKLFKAFTQADKSTTRQYGGTGLGLWLSKRLVQMMQGEIGVDSEPGRGSCFWLTLPLPVADSVPAPVAKLSALRVMVVEDVAPVRDELAAQLREWGCEVTAVPDVPSVHALFAPGAPTPAAFHVVLVDRYLDGDLGEELLLKPSTRLGLSEAALIMMLPVADQALSWQFEELGFAGCVIKPVKATVLYRLLQDAKSKCLAAHALPAPVASTAPTPAAGENDRCVLIVEDNPVNQTITHKFLEKLGYRADVADDGKAALAMLAKKSYGLVFMDCQMPRMDGYAATREIRNPASNVLNHGVPVIALTANALPGDVEKCLTAGMDDYLAKPIDRAALAATLSRWLPRDTTRLPRANASSVQTNSVTAFNTNKLCELRELMGVELPGLLSAFLLDASTRLAELHEALHRDDRAALKHAAHGLKGTSDNLGADVFSVLCFELEKEAESLSSADVLLRLEKLKSEFSQLGEAIRQISQKAA
jgi:signal transduction histidine kinase/DNA-binding response OmpR family regulator